MAICLHKLVSRAATINPILLQGRLITTSPPIAFQQFQQISPKNTKINSPASKQLLFSVDAPLFLQNVRCFSNTTSCLNNASPDQSSFEGGANEEQLSTIFESLREDLPQFFVRPLNYSHVHKDIVFENRIRGKTTHGIYNYVKQLSYLRLYGHFIYAYVKLDVIKMTKHTEDSTIKVRWRITGITGYKIVFKMLQFRVWDPKQMIEQHKSTWIDGFSTFHVNNEGFIVRHIADKVMPDEDKELNPIEKVVNNLGQVPKLAIFVKLSTDLAPTVL